MKTEFIYKVLAELCKLKNSPHTCSVFGGIYCGGVSCSRATKQEWKEAYPHVPPKLRKHISDRISILGNSSNPRDIAVLLVTLYKKDSSITQRRMD